jgi:protein-tyrosine phosphatase
MMGRVLFLCSANYYRSRFAEHVFNWLAEKHRIPWRADSRGLMVGHWGNIGPLSTFTVDRLNALGIPVEENSRFPIQLSEADLAESDLVVAVKEAEHRKLLDQLFPAWSDRVEYWHIDDLDCAQPEDALPLLENEVRSLAKRLSEETAQGN